MITFAELQFRLLAHLRSRVTNGELTERGIARRIGLSQPHIHNILKGVRALSPDVGDQILVHLRISLVDLLEPVEVARRRAPGSTEQYESCYIPVLPDPIGPGFPWPGSAGQPRRFLIEQEKLAGFSHPIVARIAHDARMTPTIQEGDFALLDQSARTRKSIDPEGLYLVKSGTSGLFRRIRFGSGGVLYLVTEDSLETPAGWQKVTLASLDTTHIVRARAHLVSPDYEPFWDKLSA